MNLPIKGYVKQSKFKILCLFLICCTLQSNCQFQGELLKFKLAALNLPNTDLDFEGSSDPYAILFTSMQRDGEHRVWEKFAQTSVKKDTLTPVWEETLVYQYIEGANQTWRIFVNDKDGSWFNPIDEPLGRVDVQVEDYLNEIRKQKDDNGTVKPVQMFLAHPIGGVLLATPVEE